MNLKEILNLADKLVYAQTDQHLNDLQEAILRGTLEHKAYKQIAKEFNCSESSVRNMGSELWRVISEKVGENISKKNFRTAMERLQNANSLNLDQDIAANGSLNTCGDKTPPLDTPHWPLSHEEEVSLSEPKPVYYDLSQMPDLGVFYNRTSELNKLKTWILQHQSRLVKLTGMSGVGKTALTVKLIEEIKDQFEYVMWYSLDPLTSVSEFKSYWKTAFFSPTSSRHLPYQSFTKSLQAHRCLVVFDDLQNLFESGKLAGKYKVNYQEYRAFFKKIERLNSQSCFILIGWQVPKELNQNKHNHFLPNYSLQLTGLDFETSCKILQDYGLTESKQWKNLICSCGGSPLWLKIIANLIHELGESVIELLIDDTQPLPEDLQDIVQQQCDRISKSEKAVLSLLSQTDKPISLSTLKENSSLATSDLINALQSLSRRGFLDKDDQWYSLLPVLNRYYRHR
ncbi:NB-ARC domain-containing protein [Spirulina sp. CS-785/01]|uniref:NB-ARC domain-containing protein n=1 Tax=Spirulina sp. CS-785/01 TaxID=3021716 RepID=UPI002330F0C4|nr:NB-ARC domain-containing protein [Spirulina sp. CS-785/01]MDB9312018.1 NB-ARC domain-containing protein [Spirulina sp. CS-785/01]